MNTNTPETNHHTPRRHDQKVRKYNAIATFPHPHTALNSPNDIYVTQNSSSVVDLRGYCRVDSSKSIHPPS